METVHMSFQIPELAESFVAIFQATNEGFGLRGVDNVMGAQVSALREGFVAEGTEEGAVSCVAPFVGAEVAKLGE
jgi:hypothetical protein